MYRYGSRHTVEAYHPEYKKDIEQSAEYKHIAYLYGMGKPLAFCWGYVSHIKIQYIAADIYNLFVYNLGELNEE